MIERYVDDKIPQLQSEIKKVIEDWNEEAEHLNNQLIEARDGWRSEGRTSQLFEGQYLKMLNERDKITKKARRLKIGILFLILGNIVLCGVSVHFYFC